MAPRPSVVSEPGTAAEGIECEKKDSVAWPNESVSVGAKANGSFAKVKERKYLLRRVRLLLGFKKLHRTDSSERSPLLCILSKLSCVLKCILDIAASMVGLRRVSKVYRYDIRGYTGYVMLYLWWHPL